MRPYGDMVKSMHTHIFEWLTVQVSFSAFCLWLSRCVVNKLRILGDVDVDESVSIYRFRTSCTVFNCGERELKKVESDCTTNSVIFSKLHKNNITLIPWSDVITSGYRLSFHTHVQSVSDIIHLTTSQFPCSRTSDLMKSS